MGLFSFLKSSATTSNGGVPHTADLLYPSSLPLFGELQAGGHADPRALLYAVRHIDPQRKRPFSLDDLDARDFGNGADMRRTFLQHSLICQIGAAQALSAVYSKVELQGFLRERGLSVGGGKEQLAARLLASGFRSRKRGGKLYELTAAGTKLINVHSADRQTAIIRATSALKTLDYAGAIQAYRDYDRRWGFVHASGKNHTIFANYDIPFSRFDFIAGYPMRELYNSLDFRNSLRACLLAGLMRGEQERIEIASCFKDVCDEQIVCPNIVDYFCMDDFNEADGAAIRAAMQQNVEEDSAYTLQYYISRVLRLSRQA